MVPDSSFVESTIPVRVSMLVDNKNKMTLDVTSSEYSKDSTSHRSHSSDRQSICLRTLNIVYDTPSILHDEDEIAFCHKVYKAKKEFNARSDIIYYMSADDLLIIKNTKTPVYLRMVIENPNSCLNKLQHLTPNVTTNVVTTNVVTTNVTSNVLPSPKLKRHTKNYTNYTSSNSTEETKETKEIVKPIESPGRTSNISITTQQQPSPQSTRGRSVQRKNTPCRSVVDRKPKMISITIANVQYELLYICDGVKFNIFVIDRLAIRGITTISCDGTTDGQITGFTMENFKPVQVTYQYHNITLYSLDFSALVFPIYIMLTDLDYELTIDEFIPMIEDIFALVGKK